VFQPSPVVAEIYQSPSSEVVRLIRRAPWLASPEGGHSRLLGRLSLGVIIAPMTQLAFFNFDLQAFLFLVFHTGKVAVLGHALFMTSEHLFIMAALRHIHIAGTALDAALLYAMVMLAWYGTVAVRARLIGWFALTVPIVASLYFASAPVAQLSRSYLHVSPAWGIFASAFLIAVSHASEPLLPPRTVDRWRWSSLRDYMLAPGIGTGTRLFRLLNLGSIALLGTAAEAWAALRLMPYNWLMLMMRFGYAPRRHAELRGWAERAWATGQPALDFVGTGGGTFLASPAVSSEAAP
jgi:hypothetical protein